MKKVATLILAGLALYTTAGAVPLSVTMPAAEHEGESKCESRCVEKERSCVIRCMKESRGQDRYDECKRDCSDEKIECEKDCEDSAT